MTITAFVSIFWPFPFEGTRDLAEKAQAEFLELGPLLRLNETTPVSICKLSDEDAAPIRREFLKEQVRPSVLTKFEYEVDDSPPDISGDIEDLAPLDFEQIKQAVIQSEFEFFLGQICLACNIAKPGLIEFGAGTILFKGQQTGYSDFPHYITGLSELITSDNDWPKVQLIPFNQSWNWLSNIPDFWSGFSSSPIGRALGAFSHFIYKGSGGHHSLLEHLWAIVGIESLFQSNGSQRDLLQKAKVLIGDAPDSKKLLYSVYGHRSGVVHGGVDFPFSFCDADATPEYESYESKSLWLIDSSIPILLSSLQNLCLRDLHNLTFEYIIKEV